MGSCGCGCGQRISAACFSGFTDCTIFTISANIFFSPQDNIRDKAYQGALVGLPRIRKTALVFVANH